MTAPYLRGLRRVQHPCRDCDFQTPWLLDLWEHRLQTGHMETR